jgi:DNA polymerase-3 subunit delta'
VQPATSNQQPTTSSPHPQALIGQRRAETILARALLHHGVGNAYLFLGATGSGKSTAARLFAQAINCEAVGGRQEGAAEPALSAQRPTVHPPKACPPYGGGEPNPQRPERLSPCGVCESCRRIAAGTHPEVLVVRPASQKGQNISVDQAREIRRNAALRPKLGTRRVYLIPNAEAFNEDSANALLKTLEEPSPFLTLILCAPNPSLVLPTVRSRCQIVRFGLAPPAEIAQALVNSGTEKALAEALARASGGRPGLAISWAGDAAVLQQRRQVLDLFARAVAAQREAKRNPSTGVVSLRLAEKLVRLVSKEPEPGDAPPRPAKTLHIDNLDVGLTYLRDLLLLSTGAAEDLAYNQDRLPELAEAVRYTDTARLLDDIGAVREAQQLLERNVNAQLVLERMFWALIAGRIPVPEPLFQDAFH